MSVSANANANVDESWPGTWRRRNVGVVPTFLGRLEVKRRQMDARVLDEGGARCELGPGCSYIGWVIVYKSNSPHRGGSVGLWNTATTQSSALLLLKE